MEEHPTETAQQLIALAGLLAATPWPTGRVGQETRSDVREEVFRVQVIAQVIAVVPEVALAEAPIVSAAAMSPAPPAETGAPSDQVPGEATTAPLRDLPVAADPPAPAEAAVAVVAAAVVVVVAGGVEKKP